MIGRFLLLLPGVSVFRHIPDQSNHNGSLLRKKEDNNQANKNVDGLYEVHFNFLSCLQSTAKAVKKAARLGGLCFFSRCVLLGSHLCHPNRIWVLKNKDQNNNNKDEGSEIGIHDSIRFRPIIGCFGNKSRAKHCNSVLFIQLLYFFSLLFNFPTRID